MSFKALWEFIFMFIPCIIYITKALLLSVALCKSLEHKSQQYCYYASHRTHIPVMLTGVT